ncbi:MAG: hypothetical protein AAFX40_18460 [Cyanobacteria bacterium J06639_1]
MVPQSQWIYFKKASIGEDGVAHWVDDEEKPYAWASLDCIEGTLSVYDWFPDDDLEYGRLEYLSLVIEEGFARRVIHGEIQDQQESSLPKFTDEERRDWIRKRGRRNGGVKGAYREFRSHPRYDGTVRDQFEPECSAIWGDARGRPKNPKKRPT